VLFAKLLLVVLAWPPRAVAFDLVQDRRGALAHNVRRRTGYKRLQKRNHRGCSRHCGTIACREMATHHSSVAVEHAMRKPVDMFGVAPRRRRRFHSWIVAEGIRRDQYNM
jgi:hypothetical protein